MAMMVLDSQGIADEALPVAQLAAQMRLVDGYDTVPGQTERLRLRLRAAISAVERRLGKILIARDIVLEGNGADDPRVRLPVAPVASIAAVSRLVGTDVLAATGAVLEADAHRPVVVLPFTVGCDDRVRVEVRAGFGDWEAVPDGLAQAVLSIAEAFDAGEGPGSSVMIDRMLAPFRELRIGGAL